MRFSSGIRKYLLRTIQVGACGLVVTGVSLGVAWYFCPLPQGMLAVGPAGAMAVDHSGGVLLDIAGKDEQKRLPIRLDEVGKWIPKAVVAVEDASFFSHFGIDFPAIVSSMKDNLRAGRIVRGASTITMQVAGLRLGHPRTFKGKAIEGFRALQIEAEYDKEEILEAWLNIAPFGKNIVGIEAASQGWLGKTSAECSLSESALLIGLPNSPERFRPDRYPKQALARRDIVLKCMRNQGCITESQYASAIDEVILIKGVMGSRNDVHAGWMALGKAGHGHVIQTTIDPELQSIAEKVVSEHAQQLPADIDIAVALVDIHTSKLHAVVGSSDFTDGHSGQVNGITSRRSPGSALKPFVFAAAFEDHRLAPLSLVDDAEIDLAGWRPENIDRRYLGEMTAADALRLSRNTPAIRIAAELGFSNVIAVLRRCGIHVPLGGRDQFGVSLVVGGMEVAPLELLGAYAALARGGEYLPIRLLEGPTPKPRRVFSPETCAAVERCLVGEANDVQSALPFVAAKTGTSSGHRDAIAAGWNRNYAAVVWVGRFDGGSDPALVGAETALPILDDLLRDPRVVTTRTHRAADSVGWEVRKQVGRVTQRVPAILEPRDGDQLVATNGPVMITPVLHTSSTPSTLFLNGRPVAVGQIELSKGRHELRVVQRGKDPHAITVEVIGVAD